MAKIEKRKKGDIGPVSMSRAQLGEAGEEVAFLYLKKNGYKILGRNCVNKFGEIDIVALKPADKILSRFIGSKRRRTIVFVEVKTQKSNDSYNDGCIYTLQEEGDGMYPERNVDWRKQKKMIRAAERYLIENNYPDDTDWQIDVIGVELNDVTRLANLRHLKNAVGRDDL